MKKYNEGSKIFNVIMGMVLLIVIMNITAIKSSAANTTDVGWGYNIYAADSTYHMAAPRQKQDTSPMYVYWSSTGGSSKLYIQTYGGTGKTISDMKVCNAGNNIRIMRGTGKYSVRNLVRETYGVNSYGTFGVRGYEGSGTVSGWWSVDSSGRYTIIP